MLYINMLKTCVYHSMWWYWSDSRLNFYICAEVNLFNHFTTCVNLCCLITSLTDKFISIIQNKNYVNQWYIVTVISSILIILSDVLTERYAEARAFNAAFAYLSVSLFVAAFYAHLTLSIINLLGLRRYTAHLIILLQLIIILALSCNLYSVSA